MTEQNLDSDRFSPKGFDWDSFESYGYSDEENASMIEELAWNLTGTLTIQELHIGCSCRDGSDPIWALALRSCESDVDHSGSWDCEVEKVAYLPSEIGRLLLKWTSCSSPRRAEGLRATQSAFSEINTALRSVVKIADETFRHELQSDLQELQICLRHRAYRAALALAGRVLEITLKFHLTKAGIECDPNSMVGSLLQKMSDHGIYCDASLKNQHNIINQYRIAGVHHKERTPVPSVNQVLGVVHVICDTLKRALEAATVESAGN